MRDPAAMRDRYRRTAYRYRHLPGDHGLRPHSVEVGLGTWTGPQTGDGTATTTWTAIVEAGGLPPKVRWLTTEEIAVGALQGGSIQIGPITPDFSGGGTPAATIRGASLAAGGTLHFRITGPTHPNGAIYRSVRADFGAALHYIFTCVPVADA